jgi:hypothetical protein
VIASDRNPRAVAFAAFNAALNGADTVECRQGDLFTTVAGERFDLIVSNPPFVISPDRSYLYRDADIEGDALCRQVVRQGAAHLGPGGFCQLLCNFAVRENGDWRAVLAEWCEGTGCDAWAVCAEDAAARTPGDCGDQILLGFALRDLLDRLTDDRALLSARLRLSPEVRLDQRCAPGADGWEIEQTSVRLERGIGYQGLVDPHGAMMLGRCTGVRPLGELLAELARELEVELETLVPGALQVTRSLVEQGFLLPA